jgi:RNA polymerase subunit RPABC4/transcription elongation factor Spt4
MSPNDPRGASLDSRISKGRAKKKKQDKGDLPTERLAHKSCNTGKGSNDPVVQWPDHLIVVDPAPLIAAAERLERKGGREAMARCPTRQDADLVAEWLVDRLSRLAPELKVQTEIASTGGQHLVSLRAV